LTRVLIILVEYKPVRLHRNASCNVCVELQVGIVSLVDEKLTIRHHTIVTSLCQQIFELLKQGTQKTKDDEILALLPDK
jgi:hypothetical protein